MEEQDFSEILDLKMIESFFSQQNSISMLLTGVSQQ